MWQGLPARRVAHGAAARNAVITVPETTVEPVRTVARSTAVDLIRNVAGRVDGDRWIRAARR